MPAIKIEGFSGLSPRTGKTQLQDNQAQLARNVRLQSGEIRPWRKEVFIQDAQVASAGTIYKMAGPSDSVWVSWGSDVDVVSSPLADTSDYRIYYTGDGVPKKTNWSLATTGTGNYPRAWRHMGVPAPAAAPTLSSSGGSTPETRAYVYTYVSTFGALKEESAPSPAATVSTMATGATVTVNGFSAAPTSGYNITHIRIYRTVTGGTETVYKFVAEITIGTASYADTKAVTALGNELETTYYNEPPTGLKGLVSMANGILAGFVGNSVYFCEPYQPHAWPVTYILNTEFPIVGLGVYGTTLVVCTTMNPYLISGTHPATMSQEKLSMTQACVSKRSIAFDQNGVLYASPYGLVAIGPGVQDVISTPIMTYTEWQELNPVSIVAKLYGNMYMGFYSTTEEQMAAVLTRGDEPAMTTFDFPASAVYVDRSTGELFACSSEDNKIYHLDGDPLNKNIFEWRSKRFIMPRPINFSCMQANADFEAVQDASTYNDTVAQVTASNAATYAYGQSNGPLYGEFNWVMWGERQWNGSAMVEVPDAADVRYTTVIVYADGEQVFSAPITSMTPVRMPAGFTARRWEIYISGNMDVMSVALATSISELKEL